MPTPNVAAPKTSELWSANPAAPSKASASSAVAMGGNRTAADEFEHPSGNDPTRTATKDPVAKSESPAGSASPPSADVKSIVESPPQTEAVKRDAVVEFELASDSPLPDLPIFDPPRLASGTRSPSLQEPRSVRPPSVPPSSPPSRSESTNTVLPQPPPGIQAAEGPQESATEAKLRMRRAELRTRVNLAIFAGGTLIMVLFAWLVIRFSRPN